MFRALAIFAAITACASSAFAIPRGGEVHVYEEFTPEMIEELRVYAAQFWAHMDDPDLVPAPSDEFSFPTSDNFDPFYLTSALMSEVYADQLVSNPDLGIPYHIEDLIRDDPQVLDAFRHHTLTGELLTPMASTSAVSRHLQLALLGEVVEEAELECEPIYIVKAQAPEVRGEMVANVFDESFSQVASKKKPKPCNPTGPPPVTIPQPLRDAVRDSGLDEDCWLADGGWWFSDPGFDCDDFADAMAEWLKRQFPDAEIWNLYFSYATGGHAMTVIRIDGYFYLIDAQYGVIRGPFETAQEVQEAAKKIMEDLYGVEFYWIDPYRRYRWVAPGWRPSLREPVRWWEDEDMLEHFCDCFGKDPNDYMPADQPDYQCP
ncbi:MAG: hypothetical protein Tsb0013_16990 [Phycisphaerales bacterium]